MSFSSKDSQVEGRKLKVQRLEIPFSIVGNAVAASVVPTNDEPSLMFIRTEGVDQITGALDAGDTATFSVAADDSDGTFNLLIKVKEKIAKVCSVRASRRSAVLAEADDAMVAALGNASGVVQTASGNGDKLMITVDGELSLAAANTLNGCIEVSYIVAEE